ncbi:MAG: hypothetical protein HC892_05680 [Saprospiraceae bacterium]|nr:hypothetical protein [Saprospiraceae bacterium]
MNLRNNDNSLAIIDLVADYEMKAQDGVAVFFEEAAFLSLTDYYEQERMPERALEVVIQALDCHPFLSIFSCAKPCCLFATIRKQEH